ncbi:FecCD family ABC transporter permease [Actinoalloteichus fjordicus]|uniref:ABC-type enterobactin transport system, permease component n=1 Tax=Actinoalloteichus fjordicus TaxID=1612552 RepID=A0AAC9PRS1_9PSEU|nr:iron chelate uptake ABC transporter family permease subunit [Actinoalloteichus fjordicus]APU14704.1 ABC-type enterobactin transport system, permease component [Actinoalloteichus fjordicus]
MATNGTGGILDRAGSERTPSGAPGTRPAGGPPRRDRGGDRPDSPRRPGATESARHAVARARRGQGLRNTAVTLGLAVAVPVVLVVSLSLGDFPVPASEVLAWFVGGAQPTTDFIIGGLRLPRALTGLLVGVALGLSGALFQSLLRNPLASPDIIGITSGASASAVISIVVFGASGAAVSIGAVCGALVTALAIYLLAWRHGVAGQRLVLVGIGVAAILTAVISYVMTRSRVETAEAALVWLTGSLHSRTWAHATPLLWCLAVLLPLVVVLSRPLRALQLGDDSAAGLGVRVERSRLGLITVGVALAAVATAAAGPVSFVALVAAPIARRLTAGAGLALLPSALTGGLLVLTADLIALHLIDGVDFPVGVITGLVGAPYLLWLLAVSNRGGRSG